MKTLLHRFPSSHLALFCAAVLFVAGCVVTSVYPYYTEDDLIYDAAFLGKWVVAGSTNLSTDYVIVEPQGKNGYLATTFTADETNSTEIHLFRLKGHLFVDSLSTNRSLDYVPVHQLSKVTELKSNLMESATMNYKWLAERLEKHPRDLRHVRLQEPAGGDEKDFRIVLTADSKDLQRFVLKHLNETNAWNEATKWEHVP